jgi:uncharacterized protein YbjQ (UPF0145 family)
MDRGDIVTTPNIEGKKITDYLGVVYAREDSADKVFDAVIQQAEGLGANKIVGFQLDWQSPKRFYGSGTAVIVVDA